MWKWSGRSGRRPAEACARPDSQADPLLKSVRKASAETFCASAITPQAPWGYEVLAGECPEHLASAHQSVAVDVCSRSVTAAVGDAPSAGHQLPHFRADHQSIAPRQVNAINVRLLRSGLITPARLLELGPLLQTELEHFPGLDFVHLTDSQGVYLAVPRNQLRDQLELSRQGSG